MLKELTTTQYQEPDLSEYIKSYKCARRGRLQAYYDVIDRLGINRKDIYKKKSQREFPKQKLSRIEIEKHLIGKTLRRPCFDMLFSADGTAKSSWIDSLDDIPKKLELFHRKRLGLTKKPDITYAVPVFHSGSWTWGNGSSLIRDFRPCYPTPFKTEFYIQKNGLLAIISHNQNQTIWYDVIVFNSDEVLTNYGVSWEQIASYINIKNNNLREIIANNVPQYCGDTNRQNIPAVISSKF